MRPDLNQFKLVVMSAVLWLLAILTIWALMQGR
jgi:hypothetical protein